MLKLGVVLLLPVERIDLNYTNKAGINGIILGCLVIDMTSSSLSRTEMQ